MQKKILYVPRGERKREKEKQIQSEVGSWKHVENNIM